MTKRSRLLRKYPVRVSNGKNKMAANHSKPGHKSGLQMVGPSLDRFVMNRIFFMTLFFIKRSRLEVITTI